MSANYSYKEGNLEVVVILALLDDGRIAVVDADRAFHDPLVSDEKAQRFEVALRFPSHEMVRVEQVK